MKQPDPKWHMIISFVKSALRIVAGLGFVYGLVAVGGALLITAELLGILEEIV